MAGDGYREGDTIRGLAGLRVVSCRHDTAGLAITLRCAREDELDSRVGLWNEFEYQPAGGSPVVIGESGWEVTVSLVGRTVDAAEADEGTLRLDFDDGARIRCRPDGSYEAWQVMGPDVGMVICMQSGELAEWAPDGPAYHVNAADQTVTEVEPRRWGVPRRD